MADEIIVETTSTQVIEVSSPGPQGPAGAAGSGLETLTTKGDTLYRGETTGERLPIGATGQVLKVSAQGIPAWANESGAVTSVNGETGAVVLTPADLDAADANHSHNSADVFFAGLEIASAGNANTNGIYVYGGDLNGKGVYYKDKDTFVYWDGAAWMVSYNTNDIYSSAQNTTTPWAVTSWSVESGQTSPAPSSWDRLTGDQWEAVVGQRINPTLRGDAAGKNVGGGANDVAAGNHTHSAATQSVAGFLSAADKTKLDGIASGATAATASNVTPSALGTAAAGTSANYSRADHVHALPNVSALLSTGAGAGDLPVAQGDGTVAWQGGAAWASENVGPSDIGAAASSHTHILASEITTALAEDPDNCRDALGLGDMATEPSSNFATAIHAHAASDITSGTLTHERGGLEADVSAYNGLLKISGGSTSAVTVTATGESVIGAADAAAARSAISAAAATHTHPSTDITGLAASATTDTTNASNITSGTLAPARMGTGTPSASNFLRGDGSWQTVAAGGVTSGSVDNAILRADGTGGSTSQSSDINIDDATTTTQNNVAITNQHSGQTNSALVLTPKGTGAFIVGPKPDGVAAVGGNARGTRAINISLARTAATQVASGNDSIGIGSNSTSAGTNTIAIGTSANNTSSSGGIVIGPSSSTNQNTTIVIGSNAQANNGADSLAMCRDANAGAQESIVIGPFSSSTSTSALSVTLGKSLTSNLRAQFSTLPLSAVYWGGQTTSDTANVELNLDATATNRMTIAANTAVLADIYVVARQTDNTRFLAARRWVAIRRDGSNNTALIGAVQTIGTDQSEGSPTWTFTIDADDTASVESLRVRVTGAASQTVNWRVMALYRVVA